MIHIFYAAIGKDFGHILVMTEGIRLKSNADIIGVHLKKVGNIFLCIKEMTNQGFAVGHILVILRPATACNFPSAFFNKRLNVLEELFAAEFFNNFINGTLALSEGHKGIFFHKLNGSSEV